jgi:hypothetical protein
MPLMGEHSGPTLTSGAAGQRNFSAVQAASQAYSCPSPIRPKIRPRIDYSLFQNLDFLGKVPDMNPATEDVTEELF